MCLRTVISREGKRIPYIFKSNGIHCYKIVVKDGRKYRTPFQDTKLSWLVMHGFPFRSKGTKLKDIECPANVYEKDGYTFLNVYDGVIHTMVNLKDAIDFADYVRLIHPKLSPNPKSPKVEVWECIIPKGSKYIDGTDSNGYSSLGSKSIRFIKKVYECK